MTGDRTIQIIENENITLDEHWGIAPVSGLIHHADRRITRPGGPHRTDCGRTKKLVPASWRQAGDRLCTECEEIWS